MREEVAALTILAEALGARGYAAGAVGNRIAFDPLAMDFKIAEVQPSESSGTSIVRIVIEAGAQGEAREGLRVNAIGSGSTYRQALRRAADQWIDGVFPVLHSYMRPHEADLGVVTSEIIVADHDTGRRFGWRAHLGPVLVTTYGDGAAPEPPGRYEVLKVLFDEVSAVAAHDEVFWIEAFVARFVDGPIEAACLLQNNAWPDGEAALREWAQGWPASRGNISERQFLMFEPVPVGQLEAQQDLTRRLDAELSRSNVRRWWQRLFGA